MNAPRVLPLAPAPPSLASPAYLTIAEAAQLARLTPKRIRNLMAAGILREGVHFSRPRGLRPRIFRDALIAWLEGRDRSAPVSPGRNFGRRCKVDLSLLQDVTQETDGL
jgi:hypothetical protein